MKRSLVALFALYLVAGINIKAQEQDQATSAPPLSSDQLSELLAPIALYPDPLISLILPASTVPSDIVLADRFISGGGSPDNVEDKPWDPSVKGLTRYPDTLKWLDDNLDWTTQLGDAFSNQEAEVMQAIQALRAKAKGVGNLVDTPEERIVQDDDNIRVVPAQPDSIYVPSYDPEVVYVQRPQSEPLVYFGAPYVVGPWLGYDFDWHHHHLYRGDWHRGWDYRRDRDHGTRIYINNNISNSRMWHVNAQRRQYEIQRHREQHALASQRAARIVHPQRSSSGRVRAPAEIVRRAEIPGSRAGAPLVNRGSRDIRPSTEISHGRGHVESPHAHSNPHHGQSIAPKVNIRGPKTPISRPHTDLPKTRPHVSRPPVKAPQVKPRPQVRMPSPKPKARAEVHPQTHAPSHSQSHPQPHTKVPEKSTRPADVKKREKHHP